MKIYFARHGQTNYNALRLCNDDARDDVNLTELGQQQAEAAAERLREANIEHVFISPLPRTRQTADIIINGPHRAPVTVHPGLHDIRSGFNGRPVAEYFAATAHDPLHARVNGGESLLDHKARVMGFINWLAAQPWRRVLVVAHEETARVFQARFHGLADERLRDFSVGNGELLEFEL